MIFRIARLGYGLLQELNAFDWTALGLAGFYALFHPAIHAIVAHYF